VPAQLQPAIKLAVMGQQHALSVAADEPGAAGEMAGNALAHERIGAVVEQRKECLHDPTLVRPAPAVVMQLLLQRETKDGHRTMPGKAADDYRGDVASALVEAVGLWQGRAIA
jgi:hypothetical protein